ncbi:hypothetical protein Tco_1214310 [Tanacetum coccineum]
MGWRGYLYPYKGRSPMDSLFVDPVSLLAYYTFTLRAKNYNIGSDQVDSKNLLEMVPAQSIGSSNTGASDSPYLLVLTTGMSQSR